MRMKDEDWDAVLAVNLTAGFRLSRALVRGMMKRRWGRIVGISSIVGATGNPGQTTYAAAKAGMVGFSKALAAENANRGIPVNVVRSEERRGGTECVSTCRSRRARSHRKHKTKRR